MEQMQLSFHSIVQIILGEIPIPEEIKSYLQERIDRLNLTLSILVGDKELYKLDTTYDYIFAAALSKNASQIDIPADTDVLVRFAIRSAHTIRLLEGGLQGDPEIKQRLDLEMKKVSQFERYKKRWLPYLEKVLHPIPPYDSFNDRLNFSLDLIDSIPSNEELAALSEEDIVRRIKEVIIQLKEEDKLENEELSVNIRQALINRRHQAKGNERKGLSQPDETITADEKRKIIRSTLDSFNIYDTNKKQIMSSANYQRLLQYVDYLVIFEKIPDTIQPFTKLEVKTDNEYIFNAFHKLHYAIFSSKETRALFVIFLQKVFVALSGYALQSINKKLLSKKDGI